MPPAAGDHRERDAGVGQHVQEGAAHVDVGLTAAAKSQAEPPFTATATAATIITVPLATGSGCMKRQHRLPGDGADRRQQDQPIGEGGEDGGGAHAVGEARARPPVGDGEGAPGQDQTDDVAEIVPGVGQQRERVGEQAVDDLRGDQRDIERGGDGEGAAEALRRVRMAVVVAAVHNE